MTRSMADCNVDLPEILEREFEKWSEDSGSDKIFLIECSQAGNGKTSMQLLLESEHEIKLHIPGDYPCTSDIFCVEGNPALHAWCNALNEYFQGSSSGLTLADVLNKAVTLTIKNNTQSNMTHSSDEDISEDEETQEAGVFSFGEEDEKYFTTEWELFVARKKSAWRRKEMALREGMDNSHVKDSRKLSIPTATPIQQMFSFPASSGILSNDLVDIMEHEKESGISSEPLDDNIFKWIVRLSKFQKDSTLEKDLCRLNEKFKYDYVELQMDFAMDLYPFYPPIVKLVRPKLQGLKGENLCSFDWQRVFQLSYWNPTNSMRTVLQHVKNFLEANMRVSLIWARNDNNKFPKGAYFDIEDALLRLGVVTEIPPRGGHVVGYSLQAVPKTFCAPLPVPPSASSRSKAKLNGPVHMVSGHLVSGTSAVSKSLVPVKLKTPFLTMVTSAPSRFLSGDSKQDYWAKGTGYGHSDRPGWDVDAFQAAQVEKDRQMELVLGEVQQELEKLRLEKSTSSPDFAEEFSTTSTSSSEGYSNNQNNNETVSHQNNLIDLTWEDDESKTDLLRIVNTNGEVTTPVENMEGVEEDENSDTSDLFSVLEGSSLVPFLEHQLKVDSFLEICRHTGLYQVVLQILKEIAIEKNFVPLLGRLPKQTVSIHVQLKRLAEKANFILLKLDKVSANGCIPGMAHTSGSGSSASYPGSPSEPHLELYQSLRERSAEEKLAREFSDLFICVTNALQESGCLSQEEASPESEVEDDRMDSSSTACLKVDLPLSPEESLSQIYRQCLKPLQFESWSMETSGPNVHYFNKAFEDGNSSITPQLVLRVAQELASLSTSLPLDLSSAIFARTDDDKCTLMRALITGPEGTPYSSGCFQFDIFFSPGFPKDPPKVNFKTTGSNKVRFNPNLYDSGQVCLSLLNTWAGEKGEQWHEMSTLLQVLVSIQSLILVAEPYFNEPGYEKNIGTKAGKEKSSAYNFSVRCNNIQHAMLDQLTHPSPGFEEVIKAHFYIKRHRIIKETESWCMLDTFHQDRRLRTLVNQLKSKLLSLEAPNEDVAKLAST